MELKYRCFDKQLGQMGQQFTKWVVAEDGTEFQFFAFKFIGGGIVTLPQALQYTERYAIMQSTGKNDKNATRVYVGDIVENDAFIDVVEEREGMFTTQRSVGPQPLYIHNGIEVIGNIFENTNLNPNK